MIIFIVVIITLKLPTPHFCFYYQLIHTIYIHLYHQKKEKKNLYFLPQNNVLWKIFLQGGMGMFFGIIITRYYYKHLLIIFTLSVLNKKQHIFSHNRIKEERERVRGRERWKQFSHSVRSLYIFFQHFK